MTPEDEYKKFVSLLKSYEWRMSHLYKIKDAKTGTAIPFIMNWAQRDFVQNMHYFNVILKARQLGFSTYILLHLLDAALFNKNHNCGVIAQGLKEAQEIFDDKIKFAYDHLPKWLKERKTLVTDNTTQMEFSNGSKINVGLSLRSGTYQKLHVSEYGKISVKFPEKAKEIKTGAFNTVHEGQQIFVESTAEGQSGEFYELVKLSRRLADKGATLSALDPKFHFYPWWRNPAYHLNTFDAQRTLITDDVEKYFQTLKNEYSISLTVEQRAWYAKKAELMGEEMLREFPSTPEESFAASVAGAVYSRQMRILRKSQMITKVPWEPKALVHTFWDFGNANYMAIWFFQQVGREWRMIRYYQNTGADFSQYIDYMRELPYSYGTHYVPHDGDTVRLGLKNKSYITMMKELGLNNVKKVPVTKSVAGDIQTIVKPVLLKCWFDEANCAAGIKCLDNYKWQQNSDDVWLREPLHDEFSDGADAFRTFAVGYKEIAPPVKVSFMSDGSSLPL